MESNYNNENIERFLRETSDQYRMYPSENTWKKIYSALHTRRRWFGIGLILFLSAGFVTTIMLTNSSVGTSKQITKKEVLSAPVSKESIESAGIGATPLTTYGNNYTQKDKTSILQPLSLPPDRSLATAVNSIEIPAEASIKDVSSELTENKKLDNP